jgi:hypothetical protein
MPVPKPITHKQFLKEAEMSKKRHEQNLIKQLDNQTKMLNTIKMKESLEKDKEKILQDKRLGETLAETRRLHEIAQKELDQKELDQKARKRNNFESFEEVDLDEFMEQLENDQNKNKCSGPGCVVSGGKKKRTRKNNKKSKRNKRR